jgi:septation ring formation regulator EzrA
MAMQSNIHFYVNWAKARLDEIDAMLALLEGKVADARNGADKVLAAMRRRREEFDDIVEQQSKAMKSPGSMRRRDWSPNGIRSKPKRGSMSRASSSKSSSSRRR